MSSNGGGGHLDHEQKNLSTDDDQENEFLTLSLSFPPSRTTTTISPPLPPPITHPLLHQSLIQNLQRNPSPLPPLLQLPLQLSPSHPIYNTNIGVPMFLPTESAPQAATQPDPLPLRQSRTRRNPTQALREGKTDTVPAGFPWATNRRAVVHSLDYLMKMKIKSVYGEVQCKRCEKQYRIEYDLMEKFGEVGRFLLEKKNKMHERAPSGWMYPILPACKFCDHENSAKPVINKKKEINWLFLLLGQMIGCCTLDQLKYFCKHTKNHRTGAKDRILYLTYLTLCKQLDPNGPFHR